MSLWIRSFARRQVQMTETLTGWVHGKTIALDSEAPELEGQHVEISLKPTGTPSQAQQPTDDQPPWTGEAETQWLKDHAAEFAGQWVVLDGYRLVASGPEAKPLLDEARRQGVEVPFLKFIEAEPATEFWGGWL